MGKRTNNEKDLSTLEGFKIIFFVTGCSVKLRMKQSCLYLCLCGYLTKNNEFGFTLSDFPNTGSLYKSVSFLCECVCLTIRFGKSVT